MILVLQQETQSTNVKDKHGMRGENQANKSRVEVQTFI